MLGAMLESGTQLGVFKVDREIGRGGMGVVYLARDTRLGRSVAIKALPAAFVADADRLARFEREARTLAALNHPNVAMILGVEEKDGARFLVLEYVEGRTLQERIDEGPLPVDEALSVCAQIAAGLEVAHDAGVVHRDLKPANVRVTPDGAAKVLDFGLAKTGEGTSGSSAVLPDSPTVTSARAAPTAAGVVMGTAGYMSPEQARGRSVDRRTDIWALGCVLYECLTGQSPFQGETASDTMAAVLERDVDWSKLPARTPTRVRELLKRCLEKDVKKRLRDIGDARMELEQAIAQREWTTSAMPAAEFKRALPWLGIGVGAAVVLAAAGGWMLRGVRSGPTAAVEQSSLSMVFATQPRVQGVGTITADGRTLVLRAERKAAAGARPETALYLRRVNNFQVEQVSGTDGVRGFDVSQDGLSLLFASASPDRPDRSALKYMPLEGGAALTLYEESEEFVTHLAFATPHLAVFAAGKNGNVLKTVSVHGGKAKELLDVTKLAMYGVSGIQCVAGGKWALVTTSTTDARGWHQQTHIISLEDGSSRLLLEDGAFAKYVPGGILTFSRADAIMACRFDAAKGECLGGTIPVLAGLRSVSGFSSDNWTICAARAAYIPGGVIAGKRRLASADMNGKVEPLGTTMGDFESEVIASPDGKLIAGLQNSSEGVYELYVFDTAKDTVRRLMQRGSDCFGMVWTPDGASLVYGAGSESEGSRIMARRADGGDQGRVLMQEKAKGIYLIPWAVLPDGKTCLIGRIDPRKGFVEHMAVQMDGQGTPKPIFESSLAGAIPTLSPDARWIAFAPKEGSGEELALRANPAVVDWSKGRSVTVVSRGGGKTTWSRDSKTLFFLQDSTKQMAVDVTGEPELAVSTPRQLFEWDQRQVQTHGTTMLGDGKKFLIVERAEEERFVHQINIVDGWMNGLLARLAEHGAK